MRRLRAQIQRRENHRQPVNPINPITYRRAMWIVGAILLTASVSGYFMGLRQTGSQLNPTAQFSRPVVSSDNKIPDDSIQPARRYSEQNRLTDGVNATWENNIGKLVQPVVDITTFTNVTEAERTLSLRERAARRAYDGAPPVVPHPIAQDSAAACLACHGQGLVVKDKIASKISHAAYTSCTQCHVPAVGSRIPTGETALREPLTENQFVGLNAPLKGSRAWPQAPPTIPHSTLMRNDCNSCHGPQGLFGLRTPHPDRQACVQCHVPGADLDQRQFLSSFNGLLPPAQSTKATP